MADGADVADLAGATGAVTESPVAAAAPADTAAAAPVAFPPESIPCFLGTPVPIWNMAARAMPGAWVDL